MLTQFILLYLVAGVGIGHVSWIIWERAVEFQKFGLIGEGECTHVFKVKTSLGLAIVFPVTSYKETFDDSDLSVPLLHRVFMDNKTFRLNPRFRTVYVAIMTCIWPIKLAFNAMAIILALINATLRDAPKAAHWMLGILTTTFMSAAKVIAPKTAAGATRLEGRTVARIRVPDKTYGQKPKESRDERDSVERRLEEIDRVERTNKNRLLN